MSKLKSKLRNLNDAYTEAKEEVGDSTGGFSTIPAGVYEASKLQLSLEESKANKLYIRRSFVILDGEQENKEVFDTLQLETERGPEFIAKFFNMIGLPLEDLEDLEGHIELVNGNTDATFRINVKDDGQYNNVYINEVLDYGDLSEDAQGEEEEEEEEEETSSDLSAMSRTELKAYIKENNLLVKVMKKDSDDDIRDKINEQLSDIENEEEGQEEEDEKPVTNKRTVAKKSATKKQSNEEEDDELLEGLKSIADSYGIKHKKSITLDELTTILSEYSFKKRDCEPDELKWLKTAGISVK